MRRPSVQLHEVAGRPAPRLKIPNPVRRELEALVRSPRAPAALVMRAKIVLLAGAGRGNSEIGRRLEVTEKTVRLWRDRFRRRRKLKSLQDVQKSGRPARIPMWLRLELLKIACDQPWKHKVRFEKLWTIRSIRQALFESTGWWVSKSEVHRILVAHELRPHRVRMWLHSPDPQFRQKVKVICDLYLTQPAAGDTVVCIDEKTGMQAREHKHPFKRPCTGKAARREFEYIRHGTRTLFAAFNPHTGEVFGQCSVRRKAQDLLRFMEALARRYPTGTVTVIWDNLNIHHGKRWEQFNQHHGGRFRFVYTPLHASWVNQVEIWFGLLQRRVLKHNSFRTAAELVDAVHGFIAYWNDYEAHPFRWKFRGQFTRRAA
jgi:transposase